jgi:hypothetical protein
MLQIGGDPDFAEKALRSNQGGELGVQNFYGDVTIVFPVVGEIDSSHPAAAELVFDGVSSKGALNVFNALGHDMNVQPVNVMVNSLAGAASLNPMSARLGLGLAALGRPGYVTLNHASDLGGRYDPAMMEAHAHEVLDAAFDAGIRYIDAARSYGKAEDFVGSWLHERKIQPGKVVVASKWGYTYTAGWSTSATQHEVKDHSLVAFERQLAESVERLERYLSLYQIHSVTAGVLAVFRAFARSPRLL